MELAGKMVVFAFEILGGWLTILGHHILPRPFGALIVLGSLLGAGGSGGSRRGLLDLGLGLGLGLELLDLRSERKDLSLLFGGSRPFLG
jgi:hypothetical protein